VTQKPRVHRVNHYWFELSHDSRGKGKSTYYQPWIRVGDFPSRGEAREIPGRKIKRLFTTFSQIERTFLEKAEADPQVVDILEQYPLALFKTFKIAKSLVITHPRDYETKKDKVMTTDFLLIQENGSSKHVPLRTPKN